MNSLRYFRHIVKDAIPYSSTSVVDHSAGVPCSGKNGYGPVFYEADPGKGDSNQAGVVFYTKLACSNDLKKWVSARRVTACYSFQLRTEASKAIEGADARLNMEDWKSCFLGNSLKNLGQCSQLWSFATAFPCTGWNTRMSSRCWSYKHNRGLSCYKNAWMRKNCRQTCFGKGVDAGITTRQKMRRARYIKSKTHQELVQFFARVSAAQ